MNDGSPGADADAAVGAGDASDAATAPDTAPPHDAAVALSKRGIAYGQNSAADMGVLKSKVTWWYNWSTQPEITPPAGVEFVPMVWGGDFTVAGLNQQVPQNAKVLLTFNEPNFGSQSHLTPQQAADLWPQIQAFADSRGLKLASPALNYCGGDCNETNPFTWLTKFFSACTNCRVDYIAAHWYACTKEALQSYLNDYHSRWDKPIWLTEFACLDDATITEAKEEAYMKDAVAILEADPKVYRYSWFTGRFDQQHAIDLLAGSGVLTPLGKQYTTLPGSP